MLAWKLWTRCGPRRRLSTKKRKKAKEERFLVALEIEKRRVSIDEKKLKQN